MILLFNVVVISNSTLSVSTENHIVLSCVQPLALRPSSSVIWSKDGVELIENVCKNISDSSLQCSAK